VLVSFSNR